VLIEETIRAIVRDEFAKLVEAQTPVQAPPEKEKLETLSCRQVEEKFGIATGTLANLRSQGTGPPYFKVGKYVLYNRQDVVEFMKTQKIRTHSKSR
jgi:hypothetical protein